jgi:hypothetical protein
VTQADLHEASDHIHGNLGVEDEQLVPTTDFDYDSIDRDVFGHEPEEDIVSFSDMCSALSLIVGWATASPDLTHVAGRIAALGVLLGNTNHGRDTLADIARECGVSRAAVSKWICNFRDQFDTSLTVGKKSSVREIYARSQRVAFTNHTHSAFTRTDKRRDGRL